MAWTTAETDGIVQMLAIVCEVTGTEYSAAARSLILRQLQAYSVAAVRGSLERCAAECKGRLALADIVSRLDDGRPGAEEAWARFPKTEAEAGCVTEEMSAAWGAAAPLIASDPVAARMAFREAYTREVRTARAQALPPRWRLSPGFDKTATEGAAAEGLRLGLISSAEAAQYVRPENRARLLPAAELKALPAGEAPRPRDVKKLVGMVLDAMEKRPVAPEIKPAEHNPAYWSEQ